MENSTSSTHDRNLRENTATPGNVLQISKMECLSPLKSALTSIMHGISPKVFQSNDAVQLSYEEQVATGIYKKKGSKK